MVQNCIHSVKMDTLNVYNWVNSTKKLCTFEVQFFHGFLQKMNAFFVKNCKKTNTLNVQNSVNSTKNCVHLVKNG